RRIRNVSRVLTHFAVEIDAEKRNGQFLTTRSRTSYKKSAIIGIESRVRYGMKIAGEFASHYQPRRFTQLVTALQFHFNFATRCFRDHRQHAPWSNRHDLRRHFTEQHRAAARIARVETNAIDHDLSAGDGVERIYIQDSACVTHKSRSSYDYISICRKETQKKVLVHFEV